MKTLRFLFCLGVLFFGLMANTDCDDSNRHHSDEPDCKVGDFKVCSTGLLGVCSVGVRTCENGQYSACEQEVQASAEICDDRDNDCNGIADGQCSIDLNSMPEYDGHYYSWSDSMINTKELKVSGHGHVNGISEYPLPERQSAFITFDLTQFEGDWNNVYGLSLNLYPNFILTGPYIVPPTPPTAISVRLWDLNNDYSNVADCSYSIVCTATCTTTITPDGCQFPEFTSSEVLFSLFPVGDGWYGLSDADKPIFKQLLENHAGEKVTLWLDYDAAWNYYIMDETPAYDYRLDQTILAPPTLSIEYSE